MILILLTLLQFITGFGLLACFRVRLQPALHFAIALITGVAVQSFIPFLMELCFIPITSQGIFSFLIIAAILLNIPNVSAYAKKKRRPARPHITLHIEEIPALLLILLIVAGSVWRCYYFPPTPRDLTSGPEVIATYTVTENTMVNSVFSVNLESTNNPYKPAFITSLQVIYKMAGFPFGQIWLSTLFVSFILFLYHVLSIRLHRMLAGILVVFFLAIPEMYAYTFMVLFDYSNAVFYCLGLYFLFEHLRLDNKPELALSGFMMAVATYARSETLVLLFFSLPLFIYQLRLRQKPVRSLLVQTLIFILPSALAYYLSVPLYLNHYLPVKYEVASLINNHIGTVGPFFDRLADIGTELIFNQNGIVYYAYFMYIFMVLVLLDTVIYQKWSKSALYWLYSVAAVYVGLALLGFLLPLMDLDHSTKRGLFKIFPLMLLYMGYSPCLKYLAGQIKRWQHAPSGASVRRKA